MRQSLSATAEPQRRVIYSGFNRDPEAERRIASFPAALRPAVEPLIRDSVRLADLADSFPALLVALATGSPGATATARSAVENGEPLKVAAGHLTLPMWLRKVPAGALGAPLALLPADPNLGARLLTLMPSRASSAAAWLERIAVANALGEPELTLWTARQLRGLRPIAKGPAFFTLLAWGWFSLTRPDARATHLLTTRWTPAIGASKAAKEAALWRERLALDICLGTGLTDTWVDEGAAGGYQFVALRNADDFITEARAMDNCLDRYADKLRGQSVRIFSVRQDGRSVANLEIAPHEREPGHPVIAQLRAPHNRRASLDVWRAAYQWLGSQPLRLADTSIAIKPSRTALRRRQDEIWQPFVEALPEPLVRTFEAAVLSRRPRRSPASSVTTPDVPAVELA